LTELFLSIIIPAFNEEHRLPSTLEQALSFLRQQAYSFEILVVENGSRDRTYQIAHQYASLYPEIRVVSESTRGKGLAVRRGMQEAFGEYRFMCDADFSMPVEEITRFLPPKLIEFDIAIASREAQKAVRYNEPLYRHLGGRMINLVIRKLALSGLHDTQCGFKCFHRSVSDDLFQYQTLTGWSFDIEVLYIARMRGYRIVEIPIPWYFNPESKLNVIKDAFQMGIDILKIRRNAAQGIYQQIPP